MFHRMKVKKINVKPSNIPHKTVIASRYSLGYTRDIIDFIVANTTHIINTVSSQIYSALVCRQCSETEFTV